MVGTIVWFRPSAEAGEHVGLVIDRQPRTGRYIVAYESSAMTFKSAKVESLKPVSGYCTAAAERRAARAWARLACSRESQAARGLRIAIRAAVAIPRVQEVNQ